MLIKWYEKLELWTSENKSDLSEITENQISDTDEELMNEQSIFIKKENVEWETESNNESELDSDDSEWE